MARTIAIAFTLGVLALTAAFLVPALRDSTQQDTSQTMEYFEGEPKELTSYVEVELDRANATSGNITVTVRNTQTFAENNTTLPPDTGRTLDVDGENVSVRNQGVRTNSSALVESEYDPTFGWDAGAKGFFSNIGVLVVLLGFLPLIALIVVATRD